MGEFVQKYVSNFHNLNRIFTLNEPGTRILYPTLMFDAILVWRGPVKVSVIWFVKIRAASQSSAGVIALEFDGMAKTSVSAWSTHHDCQFELEHVLCFVIHCCYRYQINDSASNPKFLAWTNFSGPGPDFNFQFSPLFNFSPRPRVTLRLGQSSDHVTGGVGGHL